MDMLEALRLGAAEGRVLVQPDPGPKITYARALARSGGYAVALVRAGVRPGDRVAVQVEKTPDVLWLYLGRGRCSCRSTPPIRRPRPPTSCWMPTSRSSWPTPRASPRWPVRAWSPSPT